MWNEKDLLLDLEKIKKLEFNDLNINHKEHPSDPTLHFRFNLITLMSFFKQNLFEELSKHANAYILSTLDFISSWNVEYLDPGLPSPPFDLLFLTCITSTKEYSNDDKLIKLLKHYEIVLNELNKMNEERIIRLTDCTKPTEMMMNVLKSKNIIISRIEFLIENITTLLYSMNDFELLFTFIENHCNPLKITSDSTLSHLGRIILAAGDHILSKNYFQLVKDQNFINSNLGYILFYESKFIESYKCFQNCKPPSIPSDIDPCRMHSGEILIDLNETTINPKKPLPETRSRWPLQPKPL